MFRPTQINLECMSCRLDPDEKVYHSVFRLLPDGGDEILADTEYCVVPGEVYQVLLRGLMPSPGEQNHRYVGDVLMLHASRPLRASTHECSMSREERERTSTDIKKAKVYE